MSNLFEKYGYSPNAEAMDGYLDSLATNLESMASVEVLKTCFSLMDLTTLRSNDTEEYVASFTQKVTAFHEAYPDCPLPASVCVYPNFARTVKLHRCDSDLHVTAVAACFPTSQSFLDVKLKECEMSVEAGADEIDIVLALNSFLAGDYQSARNEIRSIRRCIDEVAESQGRTVVLKVILETGMLIAPESIADASILAMEEGADFIKTSTGKHTVNATPMAAYVMCECIRAYYNKTGRKVGFKAAGGISTAMDAVCYYAIVKSLLGTEWLNKELFRFGVSRLANNLLSEIARKSETVLRFAF